MLIQFTKADGTEVVMNAGWACRHESGKVTLVEAGIETGVGEEIPAGVEAEHAWAQVKSRWAFEECRSQVKDIEWHWKQLIEALAGIEGKLPR